MEREGDLQLEQLLSSGCYFWVGLLTSALKRCPDMKALAPPRKSPSDEGVNNGEMVSLASLVNFYHNRVGETTDSGVVAPSCDSFVIFLFAARSRSV